MALAARGEDVARENRRVRAGPWPSPCPASAGSPSLRAGRSRSGTRQGVIAVLAVWSSRYDEIRPEVVEALELLAPYAALQLFYALTYGSLREHAERDPLTGLHNRRVFEARLAAAESHFLRYRRPVALAILDIDHFKRVNDTYGHEAGDECSGPSRDCVPRFGTPIWPPDPAREFVVLQPETTLAGAVDAAERLRRQIEEQVIEWRGGGSRLTPSASAAPECVERARPRGERRCRALRLQNAGRNHPRHPRRSTRDISADRARAVGP